MRIFTEGERTEINYVRGYINSYLKSKGYTAHDIIIEQPNDSSPLGLLNAARQAKLPMDEIRLSVPVQTYGNLYPTLHCGGLEHPKLWMAIPILPST